MNRQEKTQLKQARQNQIKSNKIYSVAFDVIKQNNLVKKILKQYTKVEKF